MRRVWAALVILAVLLAAPASAFAHAELVSAAPTNGSMVEGPNVSIVLVFTEALAEGSKADLLRPSGSRVTFGPNPADPTRMMPIASESLTFEPGAYTIEWTSVAADGDILRGAVSFNVTAPLTPTPTVAPSDTAALTATPTAVPSPAPSSAPTTPPDVGGSGSDSAVILPIVVALVIVAFFAWRLMRRGPRTP